MRSRLGFLSSLTALLVAIAPTFERTHAAPVAATYTVTDLGTLGGPNSTGVDINTFGEITGKADCHPSALCVEHAFYASGLMQPIFFQNVWRSVGIAINDVGEVTGSVRSSIGSPPRAFLSRQGALGGLLPLLDGDVGSEATAINSSGEITGWSISSTGVHRAFLFSNAGMINLGGPLLPWSEGLAINDSGQVVGRAGFFPPAGFLYSNGVMTALTPFFGGSANDINDDGTVTGEIYVVNVQGVQSRAFIRYPDGTLLQFAGSFGETTAGLHINAGGDVAGVVKLQGTHASRAFLRSAAGDFYDLGTLGADESHPNAINNLGQITGYVSSTGGANPRAFLYSDRQMFDLNTMIPADSGWTLQVGNGINDRGLITGYGTINSERHAFLLIPVQPPSIAKSFGSSAIPLGATTSLTFTIGNPNSPASLTGVAFVDRLPDGMIVATPNGLSGSCGGGTISATAGSSLVSLSGARLDSGESCAFSIAIVGTKVGSWTNVTDYVNSLEGGPGDVAVATLTVQLPQPNCYGQAISDLAQRYGGLRNAANALGLSSVQALQDSVRARCGG